MLRVIVFLMLVFWSSAAAGQRIDRFLRAVYNVNGECGYVNAKGDTVIRCGKYDRCETEQFYNWAIVLVGGRGYVGIDRNERILFDVHIIDNGPDYPSDGLFRIHYKGKIGYADLNGRVVIQPQYDCAFPFERGRAFVGTGCNSQQEGEYRAPVGGSWRVIDKRGRTIRKLEGNPYR